MNFGRYFLYGCGQLGVMSLARFFFAWVVFYTATREWGAGEILFAVGLAGTATFAFRIFDSVTDPIAGAISDGWVRSGRERRSLLPLTFFLAPIGLAVIFMPVHSMEHWLRWTLFIGGMFVFFVGYTLYAIPYWSLIDEYSANDDGRKRVLSNVLGTGLLTATAIGLALSPMAVTRLGYFWASVIFAVPAAGLMLLPYFAAPPDAEKPKIGKPQTLGESFRETLSNLMLAFKNRRFVAVMLVFAGSQMSFTVMTTAAPFIAVDLIGGSEADVALMMGPFILTALPAFALVPWLSRRLGWQTAVALAGVLLALVYGGAAFLGIDLIVSPLVTAALLFACGGPMAAVVLGLEGEAVLDCARDDGEGRTAIYFGVYNFVVKGMNGLALFIASLIAESRDQLGAEATRAMGLTAGGFLLLGVILYFALRPRTPATP